MDWAAALLRTPMFCDLPRRDVDAILPVLGHVAFARGQALWHEGDRAEALYVIVEGQVKGHRVSQDGTEVIVHLGSSGTVLGEAGIFHPSGVRQVSVTAMTPTVCLTIAREPLVAIMTRHPQVMRRMLSSLSDLATRATYAFTHLAFEDIRSRVARTLIDLASTYGEPAPEGVRITVRLSQASLAAIVAASRENVNRALAPLIEDGHVRHTDGFFVVHDRAALEKLVENAG
jgi:CRP/FNR family transcriptional regulator